MIPNMNSETGIRYGVVALDSLEDWVWDEFFHQGTNETQEAVAKEYNVENMPEDEQQAFWDNYYADEEEYSLETDGMSLGLSYLGGAPLVYVFQSPHMTQARECSPCIPGAGNLDSQEVGSFDCYTLPQDWFRNNV